MGFYEKYILPKFLNCTCSTKPIKLQREKIVPLAYGKVLEIGIGSGLNIPFYNKSAIEEFHAVEPSQELIKLAKKVSKNLKIPVIGIGAGSGVDGQVLVLHDMIGMTNEFNPRFLRRYMNLYESMTKSIGQYVSDVKTSEFPNSDEQY